MAVDPYLRPYTKINSKWNKDISIRPNTIKFLEEKNTEKKLHDSRLGNDLLDMTPKAQTIKAKIDKQNYIKPENFYASKDIRDWKGNLRNVKKIYANQTSDKRLISRIFKELLQQTTKSPITWTKRTWTDIFPKVIYKWPSIWRYLMPLIIREMQVETPVRYHLTHVRMATIKK